MELAAEPAGYQRGSGYGRGLQWSREELILLDCDLGPRAILLQISSLMMSMSSSDNWSEKNLVLAN
jgi:hypothetical protein